MGAGEVRRIRTVVLTATAAIAASLVPRVALAQGSSSDGAAAAGALSLLGLFWSFTCLFYAVGILLVMGSLVLWVVVLVDVVQRADSEFPSAMEGRPNANEKIVWLLIILLAGGIGALVYYLMIMRKVPRARSGVPAPPPA